MKNKTLGFIGGGRITRIILKAFSNKEIQFGSVVVFEPDTEASSRLKEQFPWIKIAGSSAEPASQEIIFLAIHPPVIMDTLKEIGGVIKEETVIISLAPKITVANIMSVIPSGKIIRMIPNATSYINRGYNPVFFNNLFSHKEEKEIKKLLRILGRTFKVDEEDLEAYAIISAMLPTYFWFQWKKMEEIAVKTGLSEKVSKNIIRSSLRRAIGLYYNSGLSPEEVIDLIPVKPIGEQEKDIETILETKLMALFEKIKP